MPPRSNASAGVSRRHFLGGAVVLVCGGPLFGCGGGAGGSPDGGDAGIDLAADLGGDIFDATDLVEAVDAVVRPLDLDGWPIPAGTTLTPERYASLSALFDALVPGTPDEPGAAECHAAWYLDQLLGAFSVTPPRIFAGGPYSGRLGGLDGFSSFLPLTRVEEICWRTYLEGSLGLPEREFNGPVQGLIARYEAGLSALESASQAANGKPYTQLPRDLRRKALATFDADFVKLAYTHAVEGTYGDPVYGGNFEQKGWKVIDFEGDRQPVGFTQRQLLAPGEG